MSLQHLPHLLSSTLEPASVCFACGRVLGGTGAQGLTCCNCGAALDLEHGLDLMVMTGLAFDEQGRRLGRGGG